MGPINVATRSPGWAAVLFELEDTLSGTYVLNQHWGRVDWRGRRHQK